jgi:biopolymer transport protein ExbD
VNFARTRRADVVVDVTPLIDIIFQLVLFFMVSTTFVTSPGIEVDLPRSSSETILRDKDDINLWVTADGAVYVDDRSVDWPGLQGALESAARVNPATLIIIKADRDVDHGRVVGVMDLARSLGLHRLAIATDVNTGEIDSPAAKPVQEPAGE